MEISTSTIGFYNTVATTTGAFITDLIIPFMIFFMACFIALLASIFIWKVWKYAINRVAKH